MSHAMSEVKSWLEHLDYFMPCRGVLVAGSGFGSWEAELNALNIPRALFVEAQNSKIERMKKLYDLPQNWQAVQGVLWSEEAEVSFYEASNSALSGLVAPETFRDIWPNATTLNVESFHATTLDNVLKEYDEESSINWLVVDCFPAVKILQGAFEKLDKLDVVVARTVIDVSFAHTLGLQNKELHTFLEEQGFRQIVTFEEINPSVGLVLYVRDINLTFKKQLETLKLENEENKNKRTEFFKAKQQLKQKNEILQKEIDSLKEEKAQPAQEYDVVTTVKNLHQKEKNEREVFQEKIQNEMKKGFANSVKQLESFVSLQNYLIAGQQPLSFHGWPISPDIALFLIQKIEQNHYDLIIEFGSGTSTAMIASILKKRAVNESKQTKLITFEHNKKYYEQTLQNLNAQSLGDYVDLIHAPLIDYAHQEETFLYYSCEQKFTELKTELSNTQQTILVLIDGPPGATGPLARFPALPHLLSEFSDQKLHLVLDDYDRAEEKAIAQKWEQILGERGIDFQSESIPSEKGLYFCQINQI
jgi:predicted O-methyltransferase YrrM